MTTTSNVGGECRWERYQQMGAALRSQQRQIALCSCTPCRLAKTIRAAITSGPVDVKPATAARLRVLGWKPAPPDAAA